MVKFVVWPSELDARLSRKYGRMVGKETAVDSPGIDEIAEAARALGMSIIESYEGKLNPRLSGLGEAYRAKGMIRVESKHPKGKALRMIAQKVREFRKARGKSKGKKRKSGKKKR
ncbi:signal recognition particle protein Srp19 [Thermococcus sp.]|uniref:signal recognition particle protein Srp19 n=1 Tax=Thermococcus sp. TaxID=35749 RepID=UPI00263600DF|nr:signal recognition particle protein Srp19 [Thermococcus sp.]